MVGWFEIYVQDMDRAKAFYENVFQVKLDCLPSPEVELWTFPMRRDEQGCGGALALMPGKCSGNGGTIVYFMCEDCAVETERVEQQGGRVHKPKTSIGEHGFIALVYDTEENLIGLHSLT